MALNVISTHMVYNQKHDPALYDSRLSRVENQLKDRLRQTTHALQAAQFNRMALDLLSPNLLRMLFPELVRTASDFGCDLLITNPLDLYQLETSLLYDGNDAHLLIHVPMMAKQSIMRLFRLHPFHFHSLKHTSCFLMSATTSWQSPTAMIDSISNYPQRT